MSKQQVNEIIKWLQDNYIETTLSLDEVKELIEIDRTSEPGIYGPSVENVPQSIIDEMERDASESGPEILWLLMFSLFGGAGYTFSTRKQRY